MGPRSERQPRHIALVRITASQNGMRCMDCIHFGAIHASAKLPDGTEFCIHQCSKYKLCTLDDRGKTRGDGIPLGVCNGCPSKEPLSPQMPSILIRGWNFTHAIARWTLAGMPRRTQEEIDERLAICQACPYLIDNHCSRCGCACVETNSMVNKLALSTEKCPEGKWE